ncbi:MAG TPA: hypothetical protein IAC41_06565 [Candidatus Merdenecus merdavium]|nr:hypothetical protein [Candidatus Merdenecus merdavium]
MAQKKDRMDMTLKEKATEELDKLKTMTLKEKLVYIWDYYKPALAGIVLLVILIIGGVDIYQNSKQKEVLYTAVLNTSATQEEDISFINNFKDSLNIDEKTQKLTVDLSLQIFFDHGNVTSMEANTKLMTLLGAKQLDLVICPQDVYEYYVERGVFLDLKETLPADLYARVEEQVYMNSVRQETEDSTLDHPQYEMLEEAPYGLRIDESPLYVAQEEIPYSPVVLGIPGSSNHIDTVIEFIEYLFP